MSYTLIPVDIFKKRCKARKRLFSYTETILIQNLPPSVSYLHKLSDIYNQYSMGSCTANCYAQHVRMLRLQEKPSRHFIYATLRLSEKPNEIPLQDLGSNLDFGVMSKIGVCDEKYMPYEVDKSGKLIGWGKVPSKEAYENAKLNIHPALIHLTSSKLIETMKNNLYNGFLIDCAFLVFPSFLDEKTKQTGIMRMPTRSELKNQVLGGHEVLCIGYDDSEQAFLCVNSWGKEWGLNGCFWMPYDFCKQESKDKDGDNLMMQILTLPISMNGARPDIEPRPITPHPSTLSAVLFNAISKIESTQSYSNSQYDSATTELKKLMDLMKTQ